MIAKQQTVVLDAVTGKYTIVDADGKTISAHDTLEEAQKAAGVTVTKKQGVAVQRDPATGKFAVVAADGTTVSVHSSEAEAQKALAHPPKPTQLPADTAEPKDDDEKDEHKTSRR